MPQTSHLTPSTPTPEPRRLQSAPSQAGLGPALRGQDQGKARRGWVGSRRRTALQGQSMFQRATGMARRPVGFPDILPMGGGGVAGPTGPCRPTRLFRRRPTMQAAARSCHAPRLGHLSIDGPRYFFWGGTSVHSRRLLPSHSPLLSLISSRWSFWFKCPLVKYVTVGAYLLVPVLCGIL